MQEELKLKKMRITKKSYLRKTKILATIGPSIDKYEVLFSLLKEKKISALRINLSHGNEDYYKKILALVQQISLELKEDRISLLFDTKGPEIRIGKFLTGKQKIIKGEIIKFFSRSFDFKNKLCQNKEITLSIDIIDLITLDNFILVDDGKIKFQIIKIEKDFFFGKALNDHLLIDNKRVNVIGKKKKTVTKFLSEKDLKDLEFIIKHKSFVDYLALSFVSSKDDIFKVRNLLKVRDCSNIKIISKIENQEAIENIDEIIDNSHGIMFARGDLGIEIPYYDVPYWQKVITRKCLKKGKPIIIATQMLETMINSPFPTRAEVTDVYNATESGVDALMLSGETAVGKNPKDVIEIMDNIIKRAEDEFYSKIYYLKHYLQKFVNFDINSERDMIANLLTLFTRYGNFPLTFVISKTGKLLKKISSFRPNTIIIGLVPQEAVVPFGLWRTVVQIIKVDLNKIRQMVSDRSLISDWIRKKLGFDFFDKILLVYYDLIIKV